MPNQVLIHCKEDSFTKLLNSGLQFEYNCGEYDVIVDDIKGLEDDELCTHYGIDYNDDVNSVEAYNFTP